MQVRAAIYMRRSGDVSVLAAVSWTLASKHNAGVAPVLPPLSAVISPLHPISRKGLTGSRASEERMPISKVVSLEGFVFRLS
jgi:hypothetical protein